MNLYAANYEWANRPKDERFSSVEDLLSYLNLLDSASSVEEFSSVGQVEFRKIYVPGEDGKDRLSSEFYFRPEDGREAILNDLSSEQFLARLGIPKNLLPKLDGPIAAMVVENRLAKWIGSEDGEKRTRALVAEIERGEGAIVPGTSPSRLIRGLYGPRYQRLRSSEVCETILDRLPKNWRNPVAYALDGSGLVPSGIYGGSRYEFLFLIDGGDAIDVAPRDKLHRGTIVWNSEVAEASFGWMDFYFDFCCGNNIVWGVSSLRSTRSVHVEGIRETFSRFCAYLDSLSGKKNDDEFLAAVAEAKKEKFLAPVPVATEEKDPVWNRLFDRMKRVGFSRSETRSANRAILEEEGGGEGGTRWDWLEGYTATARDLSNADDRLDLEKRAAKAFLLA